MVTRHRCWGRRDLADRADAEPHQSPVAAATSTSSQPSLEEQRDDGRELNLVTKGTKGKESGIVGNRVHKLGGEFAKGAGRNLKEKQPIRTETEREKEEGNIKELWREGVEGTKDASRERRRNEAPPPNEEKANSNNRAGVLRRDLKDLAYCFSKESPPKKRSIIRIFESPTSTIAVEQDERVVRESEGVEDEDTAVETADKYPRSLRTSLRTAAVASRQRGSSSVKRGTATRNIEEAEVEAVAVDDKSQSKSIEGIATEGQTQYPKIALFEVKKRKRDEEKQSDESEIKRKRSKISNRELQDLSYWYIKEAPPRENTAGATVEKETYILSQGGPEKSTAVAKAATDKWTQNRDAAAEGNSSRSKLFIGSVQEISPPPLETHFGQQPSADQAKASAKTDPWINPGAVWRQPGEIEKAKVSPIDSELFSFDSLGNQVKTKANSSTPLNPASSSKLPQRPWPPSQRFKQKDPLPENTICVSKFFSDDDIKNLMPDLDEAVLTRARKRAEGPRGERLMNRRASSTQAEIVSVRRNSVANSARAANGIKPSAPVGGPSSSKPPAQSAEQIDLTEGTPPPAGPRPKEHPKRKKEDRPLERNIENVVFGDVTFKAWYPSWYPKEIIGEKGLNGDSKGIVVNELYVCKRCFAYAKTPVDWVRHTRVCEKEIPGEKIYTHGSQGIWSIWEVDGDVDTLFCQNLSLFAKLFLDNKSVFFDVSGFKYYLLVHSRTIHPSPTSPPSPNTIQNQIVGFFSKEKMSWDNNNLACILVFPPWQKKSLGTLLMGISYAISRREKVLGGPEKPISELGRKGYKRYWGAEVARWLLECKETDKKGKGVVSVGEVSEGTWIVVDDCLGVLREMGVVERLPGGGKGKEGDGEREERVKVDKQRVREWVEMMGLSLDRVVDESGFVEGYAIREDEDEVMVDG